jgi:N-acetylmuramoyl-L-alanine amidase
MNIDKLVPGVRYIYDPIPRGNPNRPGYSMQAQSITIHENGNPKGNAFNERNFTHGGGGPETASYHFAVSWDEQGPIVMQLLPLNENAWHAGDGPTGPGNRTSIPIEHCQKTIDFQKTMFLGAALTATLIFDPTEYPGGYAAKPALIYQHNHWSGKNCPQWMRERDLWHTYLDMVYKHIATLRKPAKPPEVVPIHERVGRFYDGMDHRINDTVWRAVHRIAKVTVPGWGYAAPSRTATKTNTFYPKGSLIWVYYTGRTPDKEWWYVTENGDYIPVTSCDRKVTVTNVR